jgi:hypothetical protein
VDTAISWSVCHSHIARLAWSGLSLRGVLHLTRIGGLHRLLAWPTGDGRRIVWHRSRLRKKNVEGGSIKESSQPVLSGSRGSWKCSWKCEW